MNMTPTIKIGNRLINTKTGESVVDTKVNRAFTVKEENNVKKPETLADTSRRYLSDLPLPGNGSRPHAIILAYTLFGLVDADIAHILGIEADMVRSIKASSPYNTMMDGVLQNVREHDTNVVRKKLNKTAEAAARKISNLVNSADEKVALAAAKDVLDRNNIRGADDTKGNNFTGINIRIIRDDDKKVEINVGV